MTDNYAKSCVAQSVQQRHGIEYPTGMQDKIISRPFAIWLSTWKPYSINARPWRLVGLGALVAIFVVGLATGLRAQQPASASTIASTLQEAPGSRGAIQVPDSQAVQPQSLASIAGTVRDSRGILFAAV